ncbi:hypothetical protein Fleli_0311 [Bernardetia litoralis DSM 6794]|uniref:Uncharacterized protein n=1 Tax=Bernardetia litoralis (strain ATCC 23117 / DSM 6794 / NBRC 15988 / NCIMB 1366 / Fx l1 / Sio-4) TaxID=880071 RepID=I4AFR3_BERLS|nr:hypothetical protein [Bernardetia litoralis]AFM02798.1 hypothetical protein Fleli_0311 [Bernardetia litoralis DSM 6794]
MRFSFLNSLAFIVLIGLFSCNSSTKDNEETNDDSTTIENTATSSDNTNTETVVEYSPDDANKEGGYFNVSLGKEKSNVKTNFSDNGLSMDKDNGVTYIMAGNTDTNISIDLKGGTSGEFPIGSEDKRSANVNINLTTTAGTMSSSLTKGTVTITTLDEEAGTAEGEFSGSTVDGKEAKGDFKLNLKKM